MNSADFRPQTVTHMGSKRVGNARRRESIWHHHGAIYSEVTQAITERCSHEHADLAEAQRCANEMVRLAVTEGGRRPAPAIPSPPRPGRGQGEVSSPHLTRRTSHLAHLATAND